MRFFHLIFFIAGNLVVACELAWVLAHGVGVEKVSEPVVESDHEYVLFCLCLKNLLKRNHFFLRGAATAFRVSNAGVVFVGNKVEVFGEDVLTEKVHAAEEEVLLVVHVVVYKKIDTRQYREHCLPIG